MKTSDSSCSSSALSFCCFLCSSNMWTSEFRRVSAFSNSATTTGSQWRRTLPAAHNSGFRLWRHHDRDRAPPHAHTPSCNDCTIERFRHRHFSEGQHVGFLPPQKDARPGFERQTRSASGRGCGESSTFVPEETLSAFLFTLQDH